jgi:hypothetical protein
MRPHVGPTHARTQSGADARRKTCLLQIVDASGQQSRPNFALWASADTAVLNHFCLPTCLLVRGLLARVMRAHGKVLCTRLRHLERRLTHAAGNAAGAVDPLSGAKRALLQWLHTHATTPPIRMHFLLRPVLSARDASS